MGRPYRLEDPRDDHEWTWLHLGCCCVVAVADDAEGPYVYVLGFVNFCMKHVMSAVFCPKPKKGQQPRRSARLLRNKQPGCSSRWYTVDTGAPVPDVVLTQFIQQKIKAEAATAATILAAKKEEERRQRVLGETFLLEHGWVKNGEEDWSAPEALQQYRHVHLGRPLTHYQHIPYGHAYNTQKQELRFRPT